MGQTITFRPTKELAHWIAQAANRSGMSQGQFIREHLSRARRGDNKSKKFMRLAGAVLAETAFYLRDTALALQMIDDGLIVSSFNVNENLPQLHALARRYKDRTPDLADLCLVRLSEFHPKLNVITTDVADFRIYRR